MKAIECYSKRIADDVEPPTELLNQLLIICRHPPLLKKTSDVLTYGADLREYFSLLGRYLDLLNSCIYDNVILVSVSSKQ